MLWCMAFVHGPVAVRSSMPLWVWWSDTGRNHAETNTEYEPCTIDRLTATILRLLYGSRRSEILHLIPYTFLKLPTHTVDSPSKSPYVGGPSVRSAPTPGMHVKRFPIGTLTRSNLASICSSPPTRLCQVTECMVRGTHGLHV